MISADGELEAVGRSERTGPGWFGKEVRDIEGFTLLVSGRNCMLVSSMASCFWANSACRRDARQCKHIDLDILKFKYHLDPMSNLQGTNIDIQGAHKRTRSLDHQPLVLEWCVYSTWALYPGPICNMKPQISSLSLTPSRSDSLKSQLLCLAAFHRTLSSKRPISKLRRGVVPRKRR